MTFTPSNATTLPEEHSSNKAQNNEEDEEDEDEYEYEHVSSDKQLHQESFERASADLEILCAAYPQEISIFSSQPSAGQQERDHDDDLLLESPNERIPTWFPLLFTLSLPSSAIVQDSLASSNHYPPASFGGNITMEFPMGYPKKQLQVISYRISPSIHKEYIEKVVSCVQRTAAESVQVYGGEECGLQCCAAALDCWNDCLRQEMEAERIQVEHDNDFCIQKCQKVDILDKIHWISAEKTLVDRKSVFQAHVCAVSSEEMVKRAVNQLIESSGKIQRATHNMYAYRFVEITKDGKVLVKHDNDDDGEDAAGSRLAQLLEMRKENGVLVLVSRWYGGIHLGPKRFAHINNVARDLLVECHEKGLLPETEKV
jgi:Uncharacterized conserved protein